MKRALQIAVLLAACAPCLGCHALHHGSLRGCFDGGCGDCGCGHAGACGGDCGGGCASHGSGTLLGVVRGRVFGGRLGCDGAEDGSLTSPIAYPYYSLRGPRDFLARELPPIGP